jgi:hypothetical protein
MSHATWARLKELEGKIVGVALQGGRRIDDCQLIALPLRGARSFWLWTGGEDVFVPRDQVVDVWEASSAAAS